MGVEGQLGTSSGGGPRRELIVYRPIGLVNSGEVLTDTSRFPNYIKGRTVWVDLTSRVSCDSVKTRSQTRQPLTKQLGPGDVGPVGGTVDV